nr:tetratricopeptide repeat protein [uncultured Flavobacterium sp.]
MKKIIMLIMSLAMTNVIVSQEKIGNKVFLYGNLEGSIVGKTLIYFGVNDPKSEIKIIKRFKELGINTVSWNNIFIPGTNYTDSERNSEINKNEISTIVIIKPNGTSYSTQSNYNTTYSSYTNSLNTTGSSGSVLGSMGLVFEIYNRTDNFNKPRAVINASADNMWGAAGSQSGLTLKVVDKVLSALEDKKAYNPKGYFAAIDSDYEKALIANPENTDALFRRAMTKSNNGDIEGAIKDYDGIIHLEKSAKPTIYKMSTVYNNKAYCLVVLGSYTDALPLANKALELDQTEAYIWDTRGELNYKLGQYQKCIDDMDNAIIIQKNNNSYFYRGLAKIKLANKTEGCEDLKLSQELGKKEALLELGKYCK